MITPGIFYVEHTDPYELDPRLFPLVQSTTRSRTMAKSIAQLNHEHDVKVLAERLQAAAEEHDLCDTFYEVIEQINADLRVPLPIVKPGNVPVSGTINFRLDVNLKNAPMGTKVSGIGYHDIEDEQVDPLTTALTKAIQAVLKDFPGTSLNALDAEDVYVA